MSWIMRQWCSLFHGGGDIKRDSIGNINWQCRKCGRWSIPVPKHIEALLLDTLLEKRNESLL